MVNNNINESVDRDLVISNESRTPQSNAPVVINNTNNFNVNINLTTGSNNNLAETKKSVGSFLRTMLNLRQGDTLMLGVDDTLLTTSDLLNMQQNHLQQQQQQQQQQEELIPEPTLQVVQSSWDERATRRVVNFKDITDEQFERLMDYYDMIRQ
jgi:hypothetical protein